MSAGDARALVYITLEYCEADLFSGNGIGARCHARVLSNSARVLVICGRPTPLRASDAPRANLTVRAIPLRKWLTTDRDADHIAFATAAAAILDALDWSQYDACLAVDWTGMNAVHAMSVAACRSMRRCRVPLIFVNFRVYTSMTGISEDDRAFYRRAETAAVDIALSTHGGVMALCDTDCATLRSLPANAPAPARAFRVILPMLRDEFTAIATTQRGHILDFTRRRRYLSCLVRLSDDKGAHRFVRLLRHLTTRHPHLWQRTGVVPLLCGAASQPAYAARIKRELADLPVPAVLPDRFLPPHELARVLQDTALNVHPALYEAYGLTMVEAAAMGAPSVVHERHIGATQLLSPVRSACVPVDLQDHDAFADTVAALLEDDARRAHVAIAAFECATSWTEREHVAELLAFTNERLCIARAAPVAP